MDEMMKTIAAYKMDEVAEMLGHGHEMNEIINMMEHRKKLEDEISKQRYYGKVEMIMNLIRIENRSMSIVVGTSIDEIAEWSGLREEELLKLRDIAYSLDETIITREVLYGYRYRKGETREEREAFEKMFLGMYGLLGQSGIMFTALLALYGEETAYGYAKLVLEMNGITNEDKLALFQKKLMEFAKLYVLRVGEWLQENNAYPYDIIASAMVYYFVDEKTFRRLLQHFEEAYEGAIRMNRVDELLATKGMYEKYTSSQICNANNIINTPIEHQLMREYFIVSDRGEVVRNDVKQGTYKGKTYEDMEEYRLSILREMEDEEDDEKALEILIKGAEELKEHSRALIYNEQYKKFCVIEIMCKVIGNMVTAEVPPEVIRSYFPEELQEEAEFIEKAMRESVEKGMMSCFYELIQEELITVEAAAKHMKMSLEEFTKKMNEVREEGGGE